MHETMYGTDLVLIRDWSYADGDQTHIIRAWLAEADDNGWTDIRIEIDHESRCYSGDSCEYRLTFQAIRQRTPEEIEKEKEKKEQAQKRSKEAAAKRKLAKERKAAKLIEQEKAKLKELLDKYGPPEE